LEFYLFTILIIVNYFVTGKEIPPQKTFLIATLVLRELLCGKCRYLGRNLITILIAGGQLETY
jgi:hypothetical protein